MALDPGETLNQGEIVCLIRQLYPDSDLLDIDWDEVDTLADLHDEAKDCGDGIFRFALGEMWESLAETGVMNEDWVFLVENRLQRAAMDLLALSRGIALHICKQTPAYKELADAAPQSGETVSGS